MVNGSKTTAKHTQGDRRTGRDRRQVDKGLIVGRERRTNLESRKPDVQELEVSASAWAELCEQLGKGQ